LAPHILEVRPSSIANVLLARLTTGIFYSKHKIRGGRMANIVENKYYLKTVHDEIDLYDRKLAHLLNFETFATEADRAAATRKLTLKRDALALTAKRLAGEGIEFQQNDLPRSFRPKDAPLAAEVEEVKEAAPQSADASLAGGANRSARRQSSPYAGTSLDWQSSVQHYMQKKVKA
jgi:hypothetical protein